MLTLLHTAHAVGLHFPSLANCSVARAGNLGVDSRHFGVSASAGLIGAVNLMMQTHSLEASMDHPDFDFHTAYFMPGSKSVPAGSNSDGTGVRLIVMLWTSFNLVLNWYCGLCPSIA
jgi:hypothetical protein